MELNQTNHGQHVRASFVEQPVLHALTKNDPTLTNETGWKIVEFIKKNRPGHYTTSQTGTRTITVMRPSSTGTPGNNEPVAYVHLPVPPGHQPKRGAQKILKKATRVSGDKTNLVAALKIGGKTLNHADNLNQESIENIRDEVNLANRIRSDRCASFIDLHTYWKPHPITAHRSNTMDHTRAWAFQELADCDGLDYLEEQTDAPDGVRKTLRFFRCTAEGMADMHEEGLVHADPKHSNVLVYKGAGDDGEDDIKVTDFGASGTLKERAERPVAVTERYLAPEFGQNDIFQTPATDVYGFGVMLEEALGVQIRKNNVPYEGIYDRFEQLSLACRNRDPAQRPSMRDVATELEKIEQLRSWVHENELRAEKLAATDGTLSKTQALAILEFYETAEPGHYQPEDTGLARAISITDRNTSVDGGRHLFVHREQAVGERGEGGITKTLQEASHVDGESVELVAALSVGRNGFPEDVNKELVQTAQNEYAIANAMQGDYVEPFLAASFYSPTNDAEPTRCFLFQTMALEGGDRFLSNQEGPKGALASLRFAAQSYAALANMHEEGWVHGDAKAGNMLVFDDEEPVVKITDFDNSGTVEEKRGERRGGTRAFRAPEVPQAGHSQASDVYSLTSSLKQQMVALKPENFEDEAFYQSVANILDQATNEDPMHRPAAAELSVMLETFADVLETQG